MQPFWNADVTQLLSRSSNDVGKVKFFNILWNKKPFIQVSLSIPDSDYSSIPFWDFGVPILVFKSRHRMVVDDKPDPQIVTPTLLILMIINVNSELCL